MSLAIPDMQQAKAADIAELVYDCHERLRRVKRKQEYTTDRERLQANLLSLQKMLPRGRFLPWALKAFRLEQEALFAYMGRAKENT